MKEGLEEVRFRFDFEGTKILLIMIDSLVLLSGGLATRLRLMTQSTPKVAD